MSDTLDTVWIAYRDNGNEGMSEPLRAFASEALADIWLKGFSDAYGGNPRVIELPLIRSGENSP